uniref:Uncharacterized protein n=1 Tax=Amphimedon queenslandica TaxID=400682 RepID=A0A1X7VV64_AMPQE
LVSTTTSSVSSSSTSSSNGLSDSLYRSKMLSFESIMEGVRVQKRCSFDN